MTDAHDTNDPQHPVLFSPDATWVPFGKAIAASACVAAAAVWADRIDSRLGRMEQSLTGLTGELKMHPSQEEMRHWVEVLQARNPQINVPPFGG